jgi:acylphosphatase
MQTIIVTISGKVQGVFYRQSTREKARELGITGIVKNLPDGTVQITATGESYLLEQLVTWCRQGPPKASVDSVEVKETALQMFTGFTILRAYKP